MNGEATRNRRPKGTGSLRHKDGEQWQLLVKVDGRQVSRVFTARNATEANKAAGTIRAELIAEHERRQDSEGAERERRQAWTVKQYAAFFMRARGPHLADKTRTDYRSLLTNHVEPYIGKKRMGEVTRRDLTDMYARLADSAARVRGGNRPCLETRSFTPTWLCGRSSPSRWTPCRTSRATRRQAKRYARRWT